MALPPQAAFHGGAGALHALAAPTRRYKTSSAGRGAERGSTRQLPVGAAMLSSSALTGRRRRPPPQTPAQPGRWPSPAPQTCSPSPPTRSPGQSPPPGPRPPAGEAREERKQRAGSGRAVREGAASAGWPRTQHQVPSPLPTAARTHRLTLAHTCFCHTHTPHTRLRRTHAGASTAPTATYK